MKKLKGKALGTILVVILVIAVLAFGVWYFLTHRGNGSGNGNGDSVPAMNTNVEASDTVAETTETTPISVTEEGIVNITISGNTIKVDNIEQTDFESCISKYDKEKYKFRLIDDNAIVETYDGAIECLEKYEFEIIEEKTLSEYESEIKK